MRQHLRTCIFFNFIVSLSFALHGMQITPQQVSAAILTPDLEQLKTLIKDAPREWDGPMLVLAASGLRDQHTDEIVRYLLVERNANPNYPMEIAPDSNLTQFRGYRPLHWTAKYNRPDMAELFLQHGANPRLQNEQGYTPYDLANRCGHEEVKNVFADFLAVKISDIAIKTKPANRRSAIELIAGLIVEYAPSEASISDAREEAAEYIRLIHQVRRPSPVPPLQIGEAAHEQSCTASNHLRPNSV